MTDDEAQDILNTWIKTNIGVDRIPVHSLTITPELRKAAVEHGFPLFSVRPASPTRRRAGGLAMPHESVRAALHDQSLTRSARLSAALDALMLSPARALWDKLIDVSRLQRAAELAGGERTAENLDTYLASNALPWARRRASQ